MDPRFRILEHPADVGIEVFGESMKDLFENAAVGLSSLIAQPASVLPIHRRHISIQSIDVENLIVRWLSEILYLYDAEGFLLAKAEIKEISANFLQGFVFGEPLDKKKHVLKTDIKAVTYHQLKVQRDGESWKARVYMDV